MSITEEGKPQAEDPIAIATTIQGRIPHSRRSMASGSSTKPSDLLLGLPGNEAIE